jgi:hypothetical protein
LDRLLNCFIIRQTYIRRERERETVGTTFLSHQVSVGFFSLNKSLMEHRTEANTNSTLGRLTVPKWKKIRSIVKIKRKSEMALPRNHLSKQKAGMCPNWPAGPLLRNTDGDHFHQPLVAEESRSYDKRKKRRVPSRTDALRFRKRATQLGQNTPKFVTVQLTPRDPRAGGARRRGRPWRRPRATPPGHPPPPAPRTAPDPTARTGCVSCTESSPLGLTGSSRRLLACASSSRLRHWESHRHGPVARG